MYSSTPIFAKLCRFRSREAYISCGGKTDRGSILFLFRRSDIAFQPDSFGRVELSLCLGAFWSFVLACPESINPIPDPNISSACGRCRPAKSIPEDRKSLQTHNRSYALHPGTWKCTRAIHPCLSGCLSYLPIDRGRCFSRIYSARNLAGTSSLV